MSYDKCDFCHRPALKTNGKCELECENRALYGDCEGLKPLRYTNPKIGANDKCPCGSGLKNKRCHNYKRYTPKTPTNEQ